MRMRHIFLEMISAFNLDTLKLLWGQETGGKYKSVAFELWKLQHCLVHRHTDLFSTMSGVEQDSEYEDENFKAVHLKEKRSYSEWISNCVSYKTFEKKWTFECK